MVHTKQNNIYDNITLYENVFIFVALPRVKW